jgi:2'-5' RNA ligase
LAATAIVMPVAEAEAAVGRWRRMHTRDGAEAMPAHVTLIYPFADGSRLNDVVIAGIRSVLGAFTPFDVRFGALGRFDADPPALYLEPTPSTPFLDLIAAIAARFPDHPPFGGRHETVIPHLTIAQTQDSDAMAAAEDDVARHLPVLAHLDVVHVMAHRAAGGWRTHTAIPL